MTARPPQEDDHVPTDGENKPFHGTNPWSGPFFVLIIIGAVMLFVLGVVVAIVLQIL